MKVLLITFYYIPDIGPDPPLMSALVEEWIKLGHSVTVVCTFPHYKRDRLPGSYRGNWFEVENPADRYKVIRTLVYVPAKGTLVRRALNYISFAVTGGLAALASGPYNVVVVYTPPPTNGLIGYVVSRLWRAPMIYNVQDIYPDIVLKLGLVKNRHLIWLLQKIESFFYAKSAAITVISGGFKQNLLAKGVPEDKLYVVYNWVDTELIRPLPHMNELRIKKGWQDIFVVLYAGNIGLSQGLELLLEAARKSVEISDIRFVIVGAGEGRQKLESQASAMGLRNVEFHDFLPEEELPYLLACADVSLVMLKPDITSETVPSKVYSIMASGRPILASVPPESDTWSIVQEAGAGICAPAGDVGAFLSGLGTLYRDEELRKELGANGRQWVVENCQCDQGARKYHDLFVKRNSEFGARNAE